MKRFAGDEHKGVVWIPPVLRPAVIRIEPPAVLIAFDVEDVRKAIGVRTYA